MTLARPVGVIPTGPISLRRNISRSLCFACAGILAALNAQAAQIINDLIYSSLARSAAGLAGISAVIWIAMFAALKLGFESERRSPSPTDTLVLGAVVILSVIPVSVAAKAGLLLCGGYLFLTSRPRDDCRKIALLLLALSGPLVWGRLLLNMFASPILALDAHVVGSLVGSAVDGNTVRFVGGGGRVLIETACSSVHNMSLAIVLWITAAVLFDVRADRRYVAFGVAMVALMFALNIARLAAIALFPRHYDTLHVGNGAALFGWAGLIGAALIAAAGVTHAVARQR